MAGFEFLVFSFLVLYFAFCVLICDALSHPFPVDPTGLMVQLRRKSNLRRTGF
jgi:hypothetical protein